MRGHALWRTSRITLSLHPLQASSKRRLKGAVGVARQPGWWWCRGSGNWRVRLPLRLLPRIGDLQEHSAIAEMRRQFGTQ